MSNETPDAPFLYELKARELLAYPTATVIREIARLLKLEARAA